MFINKSLPNNVSSIIALLSYFPPPPPVIPGPPPRRLWTCSSHSSISLDCFISDNRNSSYIFNDDQQSKIIPNTSQLPQTSSSSSLNKFSYLKTIFLEYYFIWIIFLIILLLILILCLIFIVRHRRRTIQINGKHSRKFYYHLLPYRRQYSTSKKINEENLVDFKKDSSSIQQGELCVNYQVEQTV